MGIFDARGIGEIQSDRGIGRHAHSLASLNDVAKSPQPADGSLLTYSIATGKWAPSTNSRPILIVTSSTRPAAPVEGQAIYETDTDTVQIWNGTAWVETARLGAWTTFVPALVGWTIGNGTTNCAYVKFGRTVIIRFRVTGGTTTVFTSGLNITIPFLPVDEAWTLGGAYNDFSAGIFGPVVTRALTFTGAGFIAIYPLGSATGMDNSGLMAGHPAAFGANGDFVAGVVTFEATT